MPSDSLETEKVSHRPPPPRPQNIALTGNQLLHEDTGAYTALSIIDTNISVMPFMTPPNFTLLPDQKRKFYKFSLNDIDVQCGSQFVKQLDRRWRSPTYQSAHFKYSLFLT
ncbi:hypothetical protein Agabi119p4_6827 [Agaricus bisporus var. burnettii]|uniref:Uncharacterized protein n=1 Tax=Agaricus bisporus var. burnettii TaxID=192524 RepID=A0A8H7KC29_AGABI|nr:hypothetical protein Agabi119p4_6827 [Agaricus bisporus var. burnettii]